MKLNDVIALVSSVPCRIAPVLHPGGPVSRPSRGRTDRPRVGAVSHSGTGYGIIASVRVERAEDDGEWMLRMVVRAAVNPSEEGAIASAIAHDWLHITEYMVTGSPDDERDRQAWDERRARREAVAAALRGM